MKIKIEKKDVEKSIYFITKIVQNQSTHAMHGSLSSKGDFMGGIFDRWINTIPESIIFNKIILPKISGGKEVEVITDFYSYNPKKAGIAPDVFGIKVNGKIIPFVVYDDKWKAVDGMPQIEIKTFKEKQQMISLRNQGYDKEYLVMAEADLRVDYLVPFIDKKSFSENVYSQMKMDDSVFIKSNKDDFVVPLSKVDDNSDELGSLSLLLVTLSSKFMEMSTFCEDGVSVKRVKTISKCSKPLKNVSIYGKLCDYATKQSNSLYRFNESWYDSVDTAGIPLIGKKKTRQLDFSCDNIDSVSIIKKNAGNMYIVSDKNTTFNETKILKDTMYKICFETLPRGDNKGSEYFLQKELIKYIPSYESKLESELEKLINS